MEGIAAYARQLQAVLNNALEVQAEIERLAAAIDFTPEDWQYMYSNHRPLANMLSALNYKYGE